ncbi:aldehyde dehydrogenase family protein [Rhodococcus opacus]|uniref:aldehyde dehydrogenase family protein n=1 Tax=Rhodococcus opacus TaxID=37919 RepID=UPI001C44DB3E|nr:aldehyde dehydrogenase family protein [Rhodococcus opacus]MBV6754989.1 aldehyde dehydrogenase family protein [Rhodococcus opacus]
MNDFALLIDGALVPGSTELPVIDPATEQTFSTVPAASPEQLDRAVAAAGAAHPSWAATPVDERRRIVSQIADTIAQHRQELAGILVREQGKPLAAAFGEVDTAVEYIRYFAGLTLEPEVIDDSELRRVEIHRVPVGVIGIIVPWNFPLLLLAFKLPAALLAGNTMVVKPAPTTPAATLHLGRLIAGIVPAGVVNIVSGGPELGPHLSAHPGLQKVSLTGSTETGKKVMAAAAERLTRVTLELGGNDPAIVLPDADVDEVAEKVFNAAFGNSGQICRAIKRIYVHADLYDRFCDRLAARAANAIVGNGMEPGTQFGPVQNQAQFDRIKEILADAETAGKVMPGGGVVDGPGYFVRPTIVRDVDESSRLVVEEQFGPVVPVMPYTDIDDVVARANDSEFGLAASVWSTDIDAATAIAHRISAGTVWVNKHSDRTPDVPIAGAKQSGIGTELGVLGLLEYTQIKVINVARQ